MISAPFLKLQETADEIQPCIKALINTQMHRAHTASFFIVPYLVLCTANYEQTKWSNNLNADHVRESMDRETLGSLREKNPNKKPNNSDFQHTSTF